MSEVRPPSVHIVFSAECTPAMTWQALALFHSAKVTQPSANITRLLACSDEQMKTYQGLDLGPTFVHHNMRFGHPMIDEVGYPSYNKPASVMFFLDQVDVQEEYIALLDTDMLLREPLDPEALGARPGVVVSAEYTYLVGTDTSFARRFLESHELPLQVKCGGFHIFHREDIRKIAPLWIEYTRRVRAFAQSDPDAYFSESFLNWHVTEGVTETMWAVRRKQALWQAEMYGYIFGAAKAGVSHVIRRDTMLYPGYQPTFGLAPAILHYGADYHLSPFPAASATATAAAAAQGSLYFNKMNHRDLDLYQRLEPMGCMANSTAVDVAANGVATASHPATSTVPEKATFFFGHPPSPYGPDGRARSKRDVLCIDHIQRMNEALCDFYRSRCGTRTVMCPRQHASVSSAFSACRDMNERCTEFATGGECKRNPLWMLSECGQSCNVCSEHAIKRAVRSSRVKPYDLVGPRAQTYEEPRAATVEPSATEGCTDTSTDCPAWARSGECVKNPGYMRQRCNTSCGLCRPSTRADSADAVSDPALRRLAVAAAVYGCADVRCQPPSCFHLPYHSSTIIRPPPPRCPPLRVPSLLRLRQSKAIGQSKALTQLD